MEGVMALIQKATKVELEGRGSLTLRTGDYVTKGGEGAVYRKSDTVIKLYTDPKKMLQDDMVGKIRLLAKTFKHPSIIGPQGIVKTEKGTPIGYYMPFASGEPLSRIFTNDFRSRENFGDVDALTLVERMHKVVQHTHDKQALMVDANELNWLADIKVKNGPLPQAIDVDSWAVGKWPTKVIMPSIRDWHSPSFGPLTDWYAWGIVTFQVLSGIHPFKGKLEGYKTGELERRMKDNASVFLPDVRLNRAVRDFKCIPGPLLDWYQETFATTNRSTPPLPSLTGISTNGGRKILRTVVTQTGGLVYQNIFEIIGEVVTSVWPCGVVRTTSNVLYSLHTKRQIGVSSATKLAIVTHTDGWLIAEEISGAWKFRFISRDDNKSHELDSPLNCQGIVRNGNRLFAVTTNEFAELQLLSFAKPILTVKNRWGIMGNATQWFKGVGITDVLGSMHIIAPFDEHNVAIVKTPELNGAKVLQAIAGTRYVEVTTVDARGIYQVLGFAFDAGWKKYTVATRTIDQPELNTVILPKGVAARIENDGELIVYVPHKGEQKILNEKDIATTLRLTYVDEKVVYIKDGAVWTLRMK